MVLPIAQPRPRPIAAACPAPACPSAARRGRRAFTLGELAISLGLVSVLLVAMGSAMVVSGRAVGVSATHAADARVDDAVATLASEQRLALAILEHTPTSITFTVPDRNADGVTETIRYAWSGVPGEPLTRQYNGEAPAVIVRDVRHFQLRYIDNAPPAVQELESGEVLLASHLPGAAPGGTNPSFSMSSLNWCSQYFMPTFPADKKVSSWQVTRVNIRCFRTTASTDRRWNVQIRDATLAQQPGVLVLGNETATISVGSLGTTPAFLTTPLTFTNVKDLDPQKGVCVVISQPLTGSVGAISTQSGGTPMPPNTHFMSSTTGGSSWSSKQDTRDMYIQVYGKYRYTQ